MLGSRGGEAGGTCNSSGAGWVIRQTVSEDEVCNVLQMLHTSKHHPFHTNLVYMGAYSNFKGLSRRQWSDCGHKSNLIDQHICATQCTLEVPKYSYW